MKTQPASAFKETVDLYRKLNHPELDGNHFNCSFVLNQELEPLVRALWTPPSVGTSGEITSLSVDGEEFLPGESLDRLRVGSKIELEFSLPAGAARFFPTAKDYVEKAHSLRSGQPSQNFYIVNLDYLAGESNPSEEIQKINNICLLIEHLKELTHYQSNDTNSRFIQMGFVVRGKSDDAYEPFALSSDFDESILSHPLVDLHLLEEILHTETSIKAHASERKNIFRVSLAEVLRRRPGREKNISDLVSVWVEVIDCYEKNFETYISGFSFSKASQELADKQVELSQKLGKVLHDITGKLLSIPVSFAVVATIIKSDDFLTAAGVTLGALLLSIVLAMIVQNQRYQFLMVRDSIKMVLDSYTTQEHTEALEQKLTDVKKNLTDHTDRTQLHLATYRVLIWLPPILAALVIYLKFGSCIALPF